jgi:DNA adenine methylase
MPVCDERSLLGVPYADFIRRYDREGVLFYLDPPYRACEIDYGKDVFGREGFAALADQVLSAVGAMVGISAMNLADARAG